MIKKTTLWIIVDNNTKKILLCMKKRWFWEGFWNWPWWKVEKNESIESAIVREIYEETNLIVKENDIKPSWILHFLFELKPEWNQDVYLFSIEKFSWEAQETEEMLPKWFNIDDIPYNSMWEDDIIWLPRVLKWSFVEYIFNFWKDWKISNHILLK